MDAPFSASTDDLRSILLQEVKRFVLGASQVSGVHRIALIGSLMTDKPRPKDADVLVTIDLDVEIGSLARLGRRLKGRAQSRSSGADIFLCDQQGEYLGRTCSWRECHPRRACHGTQCVFGTRICDDLHVVDLDRNLILEPPLDLWPNIVRRQQLPADVETILIGHSDVA